MTVIAIFAAAVRWFFCGSSDAYKASLGTGYGSVRWALHCPDVRSETYEVL